LLTSVCLPDHGFSYFNKPVTIDGQLPTDHAYGIYFKRKLGHQRPRTSVAMLQTYTNKNLAIVNRSRVRASIGLNITPSP